MSTVNTRRSWFGQRCRSHRLPVAVKPAWSWPGPRAQGALSPRTEPEALPTSLLPVPGHRPPCRRPPPKVGCHDPHRSFAEAPPQRTAPPLPKSDTRLILSDLSSGARTPLLLPFLPCRSGPLSPLQRPSWLLLPSKGSQSLRLPEWGPWGWAGAHPSHLPLCYDITRQPVRP